MDTEGPLLGAGDARVICSACHGWHVPPRECQPAPGGTGERAMLRCWSDSPGDPTSLCAPVIGTSGSSRPPPCFSSRFTRGRAPGWDQGGLLPCFVLRKCLNHPELLAGRSDGCWLLSTSCLCPECPCGILRESFSRLVPGDFPMKGGSPSCPPLFCVLHACTLAFGVSLRSVASSGW